MFSTHWNQSEGKSDSLNVAETISGDDEGQSDSRGTQTLVARGRRRQVQTFEREPLSVLERVQKLSSEWTQGAGVSVAETDRLHSVRRDDPLGPTVSF